MMSEAKRSVLLGMAILGATNAPKSAYENVNGGNQAWDELVFDGLIVKENFYYVLSLTGKEVLNKEIK